MGQQPLIRLPLGDHRPRVAGRRVRRPRHGLAPLELVMGLPILLFVTALMVTFGTLATWRVRGEIVARDAAWRSRWPRTGEREARPETWPAGAALSVADGPPIDALEHPELQHPVARGPLPNGFWVQGVLDPDRGSREGQAAIVRRYPMLPRLGPYRSGDISHPVLDYKWPCSEMGIPNVYRRTKRLYVLPTTDQSLPRELTAASQALLTMPNYAALYTLDRDYDILQLEGRYVDFHPRIRHPYPGQRLVVRELCELDPLVVRGREVERLIDTLDERGKAQLHAISLRPRVMTRYFLEMYEEAVESLDERIKAETRQLRDRSLSREAKNEIRDWIDWARGELRRLEPYVTALQAYRDRLGEIEERLRTRVEMEGP